MSEIYVDYNSDKAQCPLCKRKFDIFCKTKKSFARRNYVSNMANIYRHIKSCQGDKEIPRIIKVELKESPYDKT